MSTSGSQFVLYSAENVLWTLLRCTWTQFPQDAHWSDPAKISSVLTKGNGHQFSHFANLIKCQNIFALRWVWSAREETRSRQNVWHEGIWICLTTRRMFKFQWAIHSRMGRLTSNCFLVRPERDAQKVHVNAEDSCGLHTQLSQLCGWRQTNPPVHRLQWHETCLYFEQCKIIRDEEWRTNYKPFCSQSCVSGSKAHDDCGEGASWPSLRTKSLCNAWWIVNCKPGDFGRNQSLIQILGELGTLNVYEQILRCASVRWGGGRRWKGRGVPTVPCATLLGWE